MVYLYYDIIVWIYHSGRKPSKFRYCYQCTHPSVKGSVPATAGPDVGAMEVGLVPESLLRCVHHQYRVAVHTNPGVTEEEETTSFNQKELQYLDA